MKKYYYVSKIDGTKKEIKEISNIRNYQGTEIANIVLADGTKAILATDRILVANIDTVAVFGENSFTLIDKMQVTSLEYGAKTYGGATQIDNVIFSNYNEGNQITLNEKNTVGLIIPGTLDTNSNIDNSEFVERYIKMLDREVDNKKVIGAWFSDIEGTVIENNNLVTFTSNGNYKDLELLKQVANTIKEEMQQEAVSIVINNSLVII